MAKINVKFNNKDYQIEESAFAPAGEKVAAHLSGEMKGTGATVKFGGTAYDVDSTKLGSSAAALAAHLGAIVGSGVKIVIGGVEYGVDAAKVAGAVMGVETTLAGMSGSEEPDVPVEPDVPEVDGSQGLEYTSNGDGTCYVSGIGTCTDTDVVIPSVSPDGDSVNSIGSSAFYNCSSLTSITIPASVTNIGSYAFKGCTSLHKMTYSGTKNQWYNIDKDDTYSDGIDFTVYCTDGYVQVLLPGGFGPK